MKNQAPINQSNSSSYRPRPILTSVFLCVITVFALSLTACQQASATPQPAGATAQPGATLKASNDAPEITEEPQASGDDLQQAWQSGPHADTFVVTDSGTNSTCARCHAPINWVPTMDEIPESCLTCKFEIDPPPPFIPEDEWQPVECMVCHRVDKDEVEAAYAWLAIAPIEEYEEVGSSTELCLKCHAGDSVPDHLAIAIEGAHQAMTCTECHDSHDSTATCADSSCHADSEDPPPGHDPDHEMVACVACHDSGELAVSPRPEDQIWTTWTVTETGEPSRTYSSHNTILTAPCERCHFPANTWGLSESVESEAP